MSLMSSNCSSCSFNSSTNSTKCVSCPNEYFLNDTTSLCITCQGATFYNSSAQNCQSCSSNCLQCAYNATSSSSYCVKCQDNFTVLIMFARHVRQLLTSIQPISLVLNARLIVQVVTLIRLLHQPFVPVALSIPCSMLL